VNSVVRLFTRDAALKYPRGDILLGYCPTCGFACNVSFDPSRVRYHPQCEESQSASDTFNSWHERLAGELIERHGLKGRHVVEIGCGKAEFLALLCRRGNNRGTGFDPAYAPGRTELPP